MNSSQWQIRFSMRKKLLNILSLLLCFQLSAQDFEKGVAKEMNYPESEQDQEVIFGRIVEISPEFPGGEDSMYNFIKSNLQYPEEARKAMVEGRAIIEFFVAKDGSVQNAKIVRDTGWGMGEEALRIVKLMPKWTAGRQRGKIVPVRVMLPILFRL